MSFDLEDENISSEENSFELKSILIKVVKIWPWIILSVALFFGVGYFWTKTTTPLYKVKSKFFIKEKESALALFDKPTIMDVGDMGLQNEVIILKSKPIAEATLKKLDFDVEYYKKERFIDQRLYKNSPFLVQVDWLSPQIIDGLIKIEFVDDKNYSLEFNDKSYSKYLPDGSTVTLVNIPEKSTYLFDEWSENEHFRIKVSKLASQLDGDFVFRVKDLGSLARMYSLKLEVQAVERGATIMDLGLVTSNVALGREYLNTLMDTYLALELNEKNEVYSNTIKFIDSQVSGVSDSLRFFERELEAFRSTNRFFDLGTESSAIFDQMSEVESELRQERFKRTYYQNLKDYLVRENYRDLVVPSGLGIDDPILNALIENLLSLQVEKSRILATQKENTPAVRDINRRIADLNSSIREILNNVDQNSLLLIKELESRIKEYEDGFRNLPQTEQSLIRIERQFKLNENLYTYLMEKRSEAAITKASNKANNKVIEPAEGGLLLSPKPLRNYLLSILAGLLFPVLVVIGREAFRTRIEDVKFLESKLRIPILANILYNKTENNLVVLNKSRSGISEGFRSLRANLKFIMPSEKIAIMVTSTVSGEGKTFCAMNLASVYCLTGKKTILVGCDMRKPKIFDDFNMDNKVGLSTYLSGLELDHKKVISETEYENLSIMVSGPTPPNPAELIFAERFGYLIDQLRKDYDVIILDTPPIGLVSETLDILKHADATLFVFRQNYSKRLFVDALNVLISSKEIKNVYGIFNGVDSKNVTYGYGYTYGNGYGYYEDDNKN